jgi:hypothetical protein
MTQKQERFLLEAVLENGEVVMDALRDDEFLKDIPVVGNAFRLCKAIDTFRDKTFAAKLQNFLFGLGNTSKVAAKWKQRLKQSPDEAQRIGETLWLILDRLTDLDKADLLAKIFMPISIRL